MSFDGSSHGPVVAQWLVTPLCQTVAQPQPGDLAMWGPNAHMGICIGGGKMISALNPALGTRVTSIATAHPGMPVFRRLIAARSGGQGGPQPSGQPQNIARLLLRRFGWGPAQMTPLVHLWTGESNWDPKARNAGSGALGIAQALGHGSAQTKGSLGNEYGAQYGLTVQDAQAANSGSALQQIRWGLGYIKAVYGSPAAAYQAWLSRSPHWY
jgi:cell wall-associated NlpC family hydrolase